MPPQALGVRRPVSGARISQGRTLIGWIGGACSGRADASRNDDSMTSDADRTHVFIVRIWQEPREVENAPTVWRGSAETVIEQKRIYFDKLSKLNSFIVAVTGATAMLSDSGGRRDE